MVYIPDTADFSEFPQEIGNSTFSAVSLLNVLDRCDDPRALLHAAANALHPQGVLFVATVLPFCDHVLTHRQNTHTQTHTHTHTHTHGYVPELRKVRRTRTPLVLLSFSRTTVMGLTARISERAGPDPSLLIMGCNATRIGGLLAARDRRPI